MAGSDRVKFSIAQILDMNSSRGATSLGKNWVRHSIESILATSDQPRSTSVNRRSTERIIGHILQRRSRSIRFQPYPVVSCVDPVNYPQQPILHRPYESSHFQSIDVLPIYQESVLQRLHGSGRFPDISDRHPRWSHPSVRSSRSIPASSRHPQQQRCQVRYPWQGWSRADQAFLPHGTRSTEPQTRHRHQATNPRQRQQQGLPAVQKGARRIQHRPIIASCVASVAPPTVKRPHSRDISGVIAGSSPSRANDVDTASPDPTPSIDTSKIEYATDCRNTFELPRPRQNYSC